MTNLGASSALLSAGIKQQAVVFIELSAQPTATIFSQAMLFCLLLTILRHKVRTNHNQQNLYFMLYQAFRLAPLSPISALLSVCRQLWVSAPASPKSHRCWVGFCSKLSTKADFNVACLPSPLETGFLFFLLFRFRLHWSLGLAYSKPNFYCDCCLWVDSSSYRWALLFSAHFFSKLNRSRERSEQRAAQCRQRR